MFSVAVATFLALASQQALAAEPETVSEQEGVSNADVTPFETVDAQSTAWIWSRGITNVTATHKTAYSNYYHRDRRHSSAAQLGRVRVDSPVGGPGATTYASIRGNKDLSATFYRITY
ncbi:lactococcin 972 family bacteriocin [Halalkalibacterium halodurans]|uniref:lactococcin 972 family bacteriocin n=1 Tax=Halalkalibacterium halodurans TaxID=86665 RepID=UPI002AA98D83|nr:lactococcin 972 family bacteriocin [Halalkalibacterium halodurans]MDY7220787.1 lactococcin 972 family bacteriocin [Halalkalibacterium halodurans]MDY7240026.1 lactococcin 972 family bacteriocin [Halalkalibacterium halodurans]